MKLIWRSHLRFHAFAALLAGAVIFAPAVSVAQGEHARRVGAELLVIIGDARKLSQPSLHKKHAVGLSHRINGGLSGLSLMLRLADQEQFRLSGGAGAMVDRLRNSFHENDLSTFLNTARSLSEQYPFKAMGILPADPLPDKITRGKKIHEDLCAGCHDAPDLDVERPAFKLHNQARTLPPLEFAARLVIGIRGDRATGIDNPFPDEDLVALFTYYKTSDPAID